jgi:sigma-B regulation protein RsbU (phosphoserine phosphatase)
LRRAAGGILKLEAGGMPFGTFPSATHETGRVKIAPGDLLVIYTDGVVEAENESGGEYGFERLLDFVRTTFSPAESFQQQLFASIDTFTGRAPQHDDVTCMIVQFGR